METIFNENPIKCIYCGSKNICFTQLRKNISGEKEIYRCRECKRRFVINDGFKKFRHSPIVIKIALEMIKKGASFAQTSYYLNRNFKIYVTRKTILDWKKRFLSN